MWVVVLLVFAGFFLRLYQLDSVALRGDEAFSAFNWAGLPLHESISTIATIEPHPPLTYTIFRGWGLVMGIENPFALRMLSVLLNLIGIPASYALGKRIGGRRLGLLAAAIWAVHPYQIWHAQDFRNYGMWAAFSITALWLGLRVINRDRRVDWILYLTAACIAAFTFYMELLAMAALSLFVLISKYRQRRFLARWIGAQVMIGGLVLLTFYLLQGQIIGSGSYSGTTSRFRPDLLFTWFLPSLIFGETLPADIAALIWPFLSVILIHATAILWEQKWQNGLLLLLMGFLPLLLLGLASTRLGIFTPRYVLSSAPIYSLMLAGLVLAFARKNAVRSILSLGLLLFWLGIGAMSLLSYFDGSPKAADWPALADYLRQNVEPDELVIQTSVDAAFSYYYRGPADDIGLPYTPLQRVEEIESILRDKSRQHPALWIVGKSFPSWRNAGVVESWAENNMQLVRSTLVSGLPVRQYKNWEIIDAAEGENLLTKFEDIVELVDVEIFSKPEPTGEIVIWLNWRPLKITSSPLKVFVHLIGPVNPATGTPLWAQSDHFPQFERLSTISWPVGEVFRDVYWIPVDDVPAGEYTLSVGLYDPVSGDRLMTENGVDHFVLQTIRLSK